MKRGKTVKKAVTKELAENTEVFTFDPETGPPVGTMVYLEDEEGNVIDSAEVDEDGEVRFAKLPPDANFKLKLKDTDDLSMGLDRFFVTDASGKQIGFNEEGETVKAVVGEAKDENTEVFTFDPETGPPVGTMVYLEDEEGNVIDSAEVDEDGEVRFAKLPPDANFKLKLKDTDDLSMGLDRFFVTDASGKQIGFNEEGETVKAVVGEAKEENTEVFTFDPETGPPVGTMVYLEDEEGNVIDSAEVDEDGEVRFAKLPPDANFKLKLKDTEDLSMGLDRFFVTDASGKQIGFNEEGETVKAVVGEAKEENTEVFTFDPETGPPVGTMVYLEDEEGNVIDSAEVDEDGEVRFTRLPPDANFKLKLKDAQDLSMGLDRFFVTDASGNKVGFDENGETVLAVIGRGKASKFMTYTFTYKPLPPMGSWVYLLDESNYVVDSAQVGPDGTFRFNRLDPEKNYSMRIVAPDGSMITEQAFTFESSEGQIFNLPGRESNEMYFASLSKEELAANYDQFEFSKEPLPGNGSKVYLYKNGERVDSTVVFRLGKFNFEKLDPEEDYDIGFADPAFTAEDATLTGLVEGEWKELEHKGIGFAVNYPDEEVPTEALVDATPDEVEDEGRPLFDQFLISSETIDVRGKKVMLLADGEVVDSSFVNQDGRVLFDPFEKGKQYELELDDDLPSSSTRVFSISEEAVDELPVNGKRVAVSRKNILPSSKEEFLLRISSFDGEPPYEYREYPLTPPEDDDGRLVQVDDSKVNNSVFDEGDTKQQSSQESGNDDQQSKQTPVDDGKQQVTMAKASVDYTDYINQGGVAEVVETDHGWDFRFDFNKFLLSDHQIDYIHEVVIPMLRENPNMTLVLEGHTDSIGTDEANYRMAVLRVSNVLYHIEMAGIEDTRVKLLPKGATEPIAPNSTEEGRALNRRVEIIKNDKAP